MATAEETAQRMLTAFQKLNDRTIELQREVEVLTRERDEARKQMADAVLVAVAKMTERDQELGLLEQERDNALLAVEELEQALSYERQTQPPWRGGVHPNA